MTFQQCVIGWLVWLCGAVWLASLFIRHGDTRDLSIPKLLAWPLVFAFEITRAGLDAADIMLNRRARARLRRTSHKPKTF